MDCFSQDELRGYLLQGLPAEAQARVEAHVADCQACCRALDVLAEEDDGPVRDFLRASLREATTDSGAARDAVTGHSAVADRALPEWEPFVADAPLPLQFGRFTLKRVLGSGGFGVVYLAEDTHLEREVAVKIPHLGGLAPDLRRRFLQEGTAAASLHHPHIVQLHQSGTHRGICFLVSEYCPGPTLQQLLDDSPGPRTPREAARIVLPLAEAVEHAHRNGVVHRDIKPANVILDDRGSREGLPYCPKLTDFGTARLMGAGQRVTSSGMLIGSAPYMAPEQVSGGDAVGPRCDIYALGVLLYELIAGELPIQGGDSAETIRKVMSSEPVPLHRLARGTPRDISAICACCLEKNPARRYRSAGELARDLQRFLQHEPTAARPLGPAGQFTRWCRRNPMPLAIMAVIISALTLIVGGLAWHTAALRELNERLLTANRRVLAMKDRAEASELHARRLRYASDIRLAARYWREGDAKSAADILARYLPAADQPELRGVEWHFLHNAVHPRLETLANYGSPLYCLCLSPDDRQFATSGKNALIRIHDRATGTLLHAIESEQGEVNGLAYSPDGQTLASAGDDGSIRMWRVGDGTPLRRFQAHEGLAFGVAFTPDGANLVTCGTDKRVCVWTTEGERQATFEDHAQRVEAIAVSPDGRCLASVGKDRSLVLRKLPGGERQFRWDEAHGTLSFVAFSPDSQRVAVVEAAGVTKWLRLFDAATGSEILKREHPDGIRCVDFSPDGRRALTVDNVGTARIWDVSPDGYQRTGGEEPLGTWQVQDSRLYAAVFEPRGTSGLCVGREGRVQRLFIPATTNPCLVDCDRLGRAAAIPADLLPIHGVAFHSDGEHLLLAAQLGVATVPLDPDRSASFERRMEKNSWDQVAMPRDGCWFALGGSARLSATAEHSTFPALVERWETTEGPSRVLLRTKADSSINDLCCSPAGDLLAVVVQRHGREDIPKRLLLLDAESGRIVREFPAAAGTRPRFTPDGRVLIYGVQRDLHVVELGGGGQRVIPDAHRASLGGLAVSGDGRWFATCDEGRDLKLWNLGTFEQQAVMEGHQGKITALAFSRDSRTLLSGAHDGTVKAWNVLTGRQLMDIHSGTAGVSAMGLSPDGKTLAVVENKQRVRIYRLGREPQ